MFPRPSDRSIVFAALAGATVIGVAACGGGGTQAPSPSAAGQPTATVTATSTSTSTETATAPATATPSSTPSASGGGRCEVANLSMRYADDQGGAGAGSVMGTLTLTNRGPASCTLRGFPGVSYVAGTNGTQVGAPATRTDDSPRSRTIAPGKSATVALRRTQPGNYGDACQQTKVTGFRVYPPDSKASAVVPFPTTGCASPSAPLLQVGPVR